MFSSKVISQLYSDMKIKLYLNVSIEIDWLIGSVNNVAKSIFWLKVYFEIVLFALRFMNRVT